MRLATSSTRVFESDRSGRSAAVVLVQQTVKKRGDVREREVGRRERVSEREGEGDLHIKRERRGLEEER